MPGHPEEIQRQGGTHLSRANFTEASSIELEADHFAAGLLLPSKLTTKFLDRHQVGLEGIIALAAKAECSHTAAAIAAAECASYPIAVIMSRDASIAYAFLSDKFKSLGQLAFLQKGSPLPNGLTRTFNATPAKVQAGERACGQTHIGEWFGGPSGIALDEELIGLGNYGFTLTVLSTEDPAPASDEEEDEDADLETSWTPKFAYGR